MPVPEPTGHSAMTKAAVTFLVVLIIAGGVTLAHLLNEVL